MSEQEKLREAIREVREWRDRAWQHFNTPNLDAVLAAAESTLPKTKMVEVWRVEYAEWSFQNSLGGKWEPRLVACWSADMAHDHAGMLEIAGPRSKANYRCVRVTGPHQQEIPA